MNEDQAPVARNDFRFTGEGAEYFRIWIVNLFLSIITVGIYSAWAKVRREQYFHRHTVLADSSFEYHGSAVAILKGRLIVVALFLGYNMVSALNPVLGLVAGLVFAAALPWIICQAMRFRAWNTSWRGVRLHFDGTYGGVARVYFLNGLLVLLTLGIASPWWLNRFQRYIMGNLRFGEHRFTSEPPVWDYFKPMLVLIGLFVAGIVAITTTAAGMVAGGGVGAGIGLLLMPFIVVFYIALFLVSGSYVRARLGNALWNHTAVEANRFESRLQARQLFFLLATNTVALILTLGFFAPFAKVRMARYRAQTMSVLSESGLEDFVAAAAERQRALGDEAAEMFDVDVAV